MHSDNKTVSLRSWQSCLDARLTFCRGAVIQKIGSGDEAFDIPPNLTRLLHNTASYAGYKTTSNYPQLLVTTQPTIANNYHQLLATTNEY